MAPSVRRRGRAVYLDFAGGPRTQIVAESAEGAWVGVQLAGAKPPPTALPPTDSPTICVWGPPANTQFGRIYVR